MFPLPLGARECLAHLFEACQKLGRKILLSPFYYDLTNIFKKQDLQQLDNWASVLYCVVSAFHRAVIFSTPCQHRQVLPHPFRDESPWGCLGRKLVASVGLPHLGSVFYVSAGAGGCGSVCPWAAGYLMHLTGPQAISCTCLPRGTAGQPTAASARPWSLTRSCGHQPTSHPIT